MDFPPKIWHFPSITKTLVAPQTLPEMFSGCDSTLAGQSSEAKQTKFQAHYRDTNHHSKHVVPHDSCQKRLHMDLRITDPFEYVIVSSAKIDFACTKDTNVFWT